MHRKSLEAAEHLKEDTTSSDKEDNSSRTDASDRGTATPTPAPPNAHSQSHVNILLNFLIIDIAAKLTD